MDIDNTVKLLLDCKDNYPNLVDKGFDHNDGTIVNQGAQANGFDVGVDGMCMNFDGSNDYVTVDAISGFTGGFTIMCWINPQVQPGRARVFNSALWTTCFFETGASTLAFFAGNGAAYGAAGTDADFIEYNKWTHMAITNDGTNGRLYKNGVLGDITTSGGLGSMSDTLYFGTGTSIADRFLGKIDRMIVTDRILSTGELLAEYNNFKQ